SISNCKQNSARGGLASFAAAGLVALLPALASFFGAAVLALPPLAVFWPLGAPFFWLAPFLEEAVSGATVAPWSPTVAACSATAAACSVVVASAVFILVSPFCALVGARRFITL